MFFGSTRTTHRARWSTPLARRAFAIVALTLLVGCQGNQYNVTRGCGSSGQRTPDTSSPVKRRDPSRASDEALTWEELVGEAPRTFDASAPVEPPPSEDEP